MSTQTPNLSLNKPAEGDTDWAAEINDNWDTLDDAVVKTLAKGDLITATADGTPASLSAGTNDYLLVPDTGEAKGLKWVKGGRFVPRNDESAAWDWSALTTDGAWHDLDCSAIVPAGATAIEFEVDMNDNALAWLIMRKNGNTSDNANVLRYTQVANRVIRFRMRVQCDTNQVVEYKATNTTWTSLALKIHGWYVGGV